MAEALLPFSIGKPEGWKEESSLELPRLDETTDLTAGEGDADPFLRAYFIDLAMNEKLAEVRSARRWRIIWLLFILALVTAMGVAALKHRRNWTRWWPPIGRSSRPGGRGFRGLRRSAEPLQFVAGMLFSLPRTSEVICERLAMRNLPVHWMEGMFLRPHHFQAADRHTQEQFQLHEQWDHQFYYGVREVQFSATPSRTTSFRSTSCRRG